MSALSDLRDLVIRDTLEINLVGLATIPVLAFIGPRVVQNDANACRVRIPLNYRTGNHMGSMYFGVLCAGADVVSGLPVMRLMREKQKLLVPSFKDLKADFLKRAVGDVEFRNEDIPAIEEAFDRAIATGERINLPVRSSAWMLAENECVARFATTLSIRYKPDQKVPFVQRILTKF